MESLLAIKDLSVDFKNGNIITTVLKNISFTINKGEIVAVVGESGSGKSVTALSVLQLLPAPPAIYKKGAILFTENGASINLLETSTNAIQDIRGNKIAMIFQEPMTSLNPVKTCGSQVAEAIQLHKKNTARVAKEETIKLFQQVQLPDAEKMFYRYPHEISGGQKQRVMIAMAMSCQPQLLICDEPTTALDVTVQKNILELIKKLQQENGMAVMFISHDLGLVADIADRIIVMYKGEIIEQGNASDILNNPAQPYTKALLACRPALHTKGERLPVVSDFMNANATTPLQQKFTGTKKVFDNSPLLQVENLSVWYAAQKTFLGKIQSYNKAVDDVSFTIYKGETLGLVGESGCGKTTLGRAILGLKKATSGKIFYNGIDTLNMHKAAWRNMRKKMQLIFQDPYSSLNPIKKIGEAIAEPLLVHKMFTSKKEREKKVMELLEKVGLETKQYNRYPHEFSGGQRQRIVIARALALEPEFVVCDESVSALDVSVQAQVLNLLNELKEIFEFTALFISHDLSVIRYISDRIMVMNRGKIVETGTAEDIYNHPSEEYTKRLIAAIPGKNLVHH